MNTANKRPRIGSSWHWRTMLAATLISLGLWAPSVDAARDAESTSQFLVVVHVNSPVRSAKSELLTKVFLKQMSRWENGETIHSVDLPTTSPVRERFSKTVLKRSVQAVRHYWQQRIFSGRGVPPPELDSDEAVVRYVAKHPGGVGYVGANVELTGVKVLGVR